MLLAGRLSRFLVFLLAFPHEQSLSFLFLQVFCCIAIVGIAVIYFCVLWIRQIFSFLRRDRTHPSLLPAPPRALACLGALPVYGHTFLFQKWAGGCARHFHPDTTEISCLPQCRFNRRLGKCFAVYIWGQWRVVIQGQALTERVMDLADLQDAFPWTPPITLLGKSCLPFLEEHDAEQLRMLVKQPLSHTHLMPLASAFAEIAEKCLEDVLGGKFKRTRRKKQAPANDFDPDASFTDPDHASDQEDDTDLDTAQIKVKWDALRSYTFDLIDGPVLGMNYWLKPSEQMEGEPTQEERHNTDTATDDEAAELPQRERMLLWMERIKAGIDVIKLTFGPEWMRIWLLNEYGRALNGRIHVHEVFSRHVGAMSARVPVEHRPGHAYHDPTTQWMPLLTLRDNYQREREGIFGTPSLAKTLSRSRSFSAPAVSMRLNHTSAEFSDDDDATKPANIPDLIPPFTTEQDLARPKYESSPALRHRKVPATPDESPSTRSFRHQLDRHVTPPKQAAKQTKSSPQVSVLEHLMRQQDRDGNGISQAVMSELAIGLWMMMDASNAWTAMALALLAANRDACTLVQEELDDLVQKHGRDKLFRAHVMDKMKYVDALLYEAIRLCPSFLAGLKKTTTTIELSELGVQLPKNTHIFFCEPTNMVFDLAKAYGYKPEELGNMYPTVELYVSTSRYPQPSATQNSPLLLCLASRHGFLPLQGLEVPLMVLQCKVFLVVLLQKYSPTMSKKRTFIRRVRAAIDKSISTRITSKRSDSSLENGGTTGEVLTVNRSRSHSPDSSHRSDVEEGRANDSRHNDPVLRSNFESSALHLDVGRLFTKLPFPEPRRVISIRPREEYLQDRSFTT